MPAHIEDYALVGDTQTAALISTDGSVDWLCLPSFDSDACFTALLGDREHGRWSLHPSGDYRCTRRRYVEDSLVLETELSNADGTVRIVDCMPVRDGVPDLIRQVRGVSGTVDMISEFAPRTAYGETVPWHRITDGGQIRVVAGPDALTLDADVACEITQRPSVTSRFQVREGEHATFRLIYGEQPPEQRRAADEKIDHTVRWWQEWARRCSYHGEYRDAVVRSLITLKALTFAPTGGIVGAPTTSLPERIGGVRNWDYRYCWVRDATFTLLAFLDAGYVDEAKAWREWLLRATAGRPEQMQIMYAVNGQRRLAEQELDWLPGYEGSTPVRIGNKAAGQFQLDSYGELMDAFHQARSHGIPPDPDAWRVQRELMDFLEGNWREPDNGIWEIRGPRRQFTYSKVMAWVAADRAVRAAETFDLDGEPQRWKQLREDIHDDVCRHGYDAERNTFTQHYGTRDVDAALLRLPHVGFLPATDERVLGTTRAIEEDLTVDRMVLRYRTAAPGSEHEGGTHPVDGLPSGEGAFLACSFWLADSYVLRGDVEQGRQMFEHLLSLRNDVGLLSEQYDPHERRLLGNFPQALSHIPLVATAFNLTSARGPTIRRHGND
ncbi:glycoside hydrolase family 15 protein [Haloechinothrix salitolerans]|uniref:Glycoside hydrolase family 15 protein n=1 Tax=Haloechinothrix salitolerans TaxID=926830 RepID=A0ABW2C3B9_9PSEU